VLSGAVLPIGVLFVDDLAAVLAGAAAMVGHWRPLFKGFKKGGKTVATAGGVFWAVAPLVAFAIVGLWIALFVTTRYASVASIGAALALPVASLAFGEPWPVVAFAIGAAVAVVVLHRSNIGRLRAGTEHRFALRRA
jgi:glycerol-3-phosphate acyltransferase PlsY